MTRDLFRLLNITKIVLHHSYVHISLHVSCIPRILESFHVQYVHVPISALDSYFPFKVSPLLLAYNSLSQRVFALWNSPRVQRPLTRNYHTKSLFQKKFHYNVPISILQLIHRFIETVSRDSFNLSLAYDSFIICSRGRS